MSEKNEYRNISIKPEVKEKLGEIGKKNETWSEVVLRLIKSYEKEEEEE